MTENKVDEDEKHSQYRRFLTSFLFNIDSLKIYAESVGTVLKKSTNKRKFAEVKKIIELIDLVKYGLRRSETDVRFIENIEKIKSYLKRRYNLEVTIDFSIRAHGPDAVKILSEIRHFDVTEHQITIMYQSSLISLIVFFEVLVGSIVKNRLIKYPKSNEEIEKKTLKLHEIRKLGSLENAEAYLIEGEVENILRKSYVDWISYIKETNSIKLEFLKQYDNEIIEIFQRRNLFVHNGGRVNNTYLTIVDSTITERIKLNDYLVIDKENLDRSINLIEHAGVLLCLEVWGCMEKNCKERINFVIEIGYKYMLDGQWSIVRNLFKNNLLEKEISSEKKTISQLNYWLSMKELNEIGAIKDEILKADFSDKTLRYQICLHALREDREKFFQILPETILREEVRYEELLEWPILKLMREDDRFNVALDSMRNERTAASEEVYASLNEAAIAMKEM